MPSKLPEGIDPDNPELESLKADSVTFNQDITDANNNTVTSLSDPVRVTEEASTFSESDVTVSTFGTTKSGSSVQLTNNVDTEIDSANWNGWTIVFGNQDTFTTQTSTILGGDASAELTVTNDYSRVDAVKASGQTDKDIEALIQISQDTGNSNDLVGFRVENIGELEFEDGTGNILMDNNDTGLHWAPNTTYSVRFELDKTNQQTTVIINGNNAGTYDFASSNVTGYDTVSIRNRTPNSGATRTVFFDDVSLVGVDGEISDFNKPKSGEATISFDSGSPTNIDSWDLATFQRTLDGETVTVDVVDSNGTVLKSDISKDTDISDIATSTDVQLRANLSRSDTSNNPTLDYSARRFTR